MADVLTDEEVRDLVEAARDIPQEDQEMLGHFSGRKQPLVKLLNSLVERAKKEADKETGRDMVNYVDSVYDALTTWVNSYHELKATYDELHDDHVKLEASSRVERLKQAKKRLQNKYTAAEVENEDLTDKLTETRRDLRSLRRTSTRDVLRLKKVLKDQFKYKEKDFENFKSRKELFQYLVSRVELEVATLRLKYDKTTP